MKPASLRYMLCITCSLLFLLPVTAQDFIYRHYGLPDGLPDPTIHSIFQDADGFLWIGTESGLCRYDGKQFKTFTVKDGLAGNEVFGMVQDRKGRIWFHQYTYSIGYIYKGKIFNQQNDPFLKKIRLQSRVFNIALDKDGNIGFCDIFNLFVVDPDFRSLRTFGFGDGKATVTMGVDTSGQFIIYTFTGVFRLEKEGLRYLTMIGPVTELTSNTVLFNKNYTMYGTYNRRRTVYLKDTTVTIDLPLDFTIKYSAVAKNMVSVNTVDGAFLLNTDNYKLIHLLPGTKVTNVLLDREKNLWIGTMGKGLYKVSSQSVINKRINDASNNICYITRDGNKIIAGNDNTELFEYAGNRLTKINIARFRQAAPWKVMYYEKLDNGADIVFNVGWAALQKNGKTLKQSNMYALKQVKKMDDNNLLVIGVGVLIIRKNDLAYLDTIWPRKSTAALVTGDSMLIGTLDGLFVFRKEHGKYRQVDSMLATSTISFIEKAPGNVIWIGTIDKGLYYFRDGKIARYFTDTAGLPGNNIRSMFINGNDTWVGTDHGLVKISAREGSFQLRKFSTSDGLVSDIINYIYVEGDSVYLGTPEGLCYFNESAIETNSVCNLVLTGITIGSTPATLSNEYHTGRNQRIVIEYSGISFRSEQQMTYRYRTRGTADDWQYTNLNTLEYASLPYGTYQLEIVAINKFGKESLPARITFIIDRPFYRSAWFMAACILLLVAAVLFFYARYARAAKRKQVQKLQQEIRMMELEQMALRAQMNPHFIFNCISAMQQLVTEGNERHAQLFITNFSNLVRQTLDNATELFISLDEEIRFLTSYFELERIRAEDRFSYTINTSGIPDFTHLAVPNMVIQPFVENAIRHGIRYKKNGAGLITVTFICTDETLCCTVTDNGIGRRKSAELQNKFGVNHHSKGMGITFKRIESLNSITGKDIGINIEDLADENGEDAGTKVIITFHNINFPYDKDNYSG